MIQSVERVDWREELKVYGWYTEVRKMEAEGTFQYARRFMENGAAEAVCNAFQQLEKVANHSDRHLATMLAYLNSKAGQVDFLEMPYDGKDRYWLRINGHIIHFDLLDEYEGRGMANRGLDVIYLGKTADDEFWMAVADELTKACQCELPGMEEDFLFQWSNWCE